MFFKSMRFWSVPAQTRGEGEKGLAAFASETEASAVHATADAAPTPSRQATWRAARVANWVAVVALSGSVAAAAGTWEYKRRSAARSAFLSVETSQPGMEVVIGDRSVGRTPVALWLQPGSYPVRVGDGADGRGFTVDLAAGASVHRHLDFGPAVPGATATSGTATTGGSQLSVDTGSTPMAVVVDGVERGRSPVSVRGLASGGHDVVVRGAGASFRQHVVLGPGEHTRLIFASAAKAETSRAAAPLSAGWLTVTSAVEVQIREGGKVIGSTEADRVMLPTGDHKLEFANEPLGYLSTRSVRIEPGKTTVLALERVNGVLHINAQPWAEVWLDGERVGQTPIGNLSRPIGTHEVVLRHPELGERRARVTITTKQPARLGVDLRRR